MVDISDMLFIVGHVGHIWRSCETKIFETDTETFFETKVFETDTETFFRDQIFSRPIPRLFFETKYFRDRYRDFFSRLNIFETNTETLKKLRKVSIPRSLETRCH